MVEANPSSNSGKWTGSVGGTKEVVMSPEGGSGSVTLTPNAGTIANFCVL